MMLRSAASTSASESKATTTRGVVDLRTVRWTSPCTTTSPPRVTPMTSSTLRSIGDRLPTRRAKAALRPGIRAVMSALSPSRLRSQSGRPSDQ